MTDQEYLDRCAIEAMAQIISVNGRRASEDALLATNAYDIASAMLAERKKRIENK